MFMRIIPYLATTALLANLGCATLSQRALELYPKARTGCETKLGTLESNDDSEDSGGLAFRTPSTSIGFEMNRHGIFALETRELYLPTDKRKLGYDGEIVRYLTDYPDDKVWERLNFPINPEQIPVDVVRAIDDRSELLWTKEYKAKMKNLLRAIEQCAQRQ